MNEHLAKLLVPVDPAEVRRQLGLDPNDAYLKDAKPAPELLVEWNVYDHIDALQISWTHAQRIHKLSEEQQRHLVAILREKGSPCLRTN